jgi:Ca2+/Na+ antiporter
MVAGVLLVVSFAVMVVGAAVFTNAVEWAGLRLGLGHGAVGSVLAAGGHRDARVPDPGHRDHHRGQAGKPGRDRRHRGGAVPSRHPGHGGVRCSALIYRRRRTSARLQPDRNAIARDLYVVLGALLLATSIGLVGSRPLRLAGAAVLVATYAAVTWKTIVQGRQEGGAEEPGSLYFDTTKNDPPNNFQIVAQVLVSIGMLIGGAELFVSSIEQLAHGLGVDPLILTLVIAPLATELPETLNSVIWIRQGKDTLALGNITGALVLQSMPLVAFGMVFTSWRLTSPALAAMLAALAGAALSLVAVLRPRGWSAPFVGWSAGLYLGGITAIIAVT